MQLDPLQTPVSQVPVDLEVPDPNLPVYRAIGLACGGALGMLLLILGVNYMLHMKGSQSTGPGQSALDSPDDLRGLPGGRAGYGVPQGTQGMSVGSYGAAVGSRGVPISSVGYSPGTGIPQPGQNSKVYIGYRSSMDGTPTQIRGTAGQIRDHGSLDADNIQSLLNGR